MVHSSNSRNVNGIQRVAMAVMMMVLAVGGGLAMFAGRAEAQSKLPPCPSDQSVFWQNCFGTYTFADGDKYVGEYKDDKLNGQGTYTFGDGPNKGDKYVGEYKDDKRNGQGTYTYANGNKYVGEFKDGKYNGQGTYRLSGNGNLYIGEWKDNKNSGAGKELNAMGNVIRQGYWVDGDYFGPTPPR